MFKVKWNRKVRDKNIIKAWRNQEKNVDDEEAIVQL